MRRQVGSPRRIFSLRELTPHQESAITDRAMELLDDCVMEVERVPAFFASLRGYARRVCNILISNHLLHKLLESFAMAVREVKMGISLVKQMLHLNDKLVSGHKSGRHGFKTAVSHQAWTNLCRLWCLDTFMLEQARDHWRPKTAAMRFAPLISPLT